MKKKAVNDTTRQTRAAAMIALAVLTLTAFSRAPFNSFLTYDDPLYVTGNPNVQQGLSLEGIRYAFTTVDASNWQPVTFLSHELDVTLFGPDPFGHHLVNVLWHMANVLLLFHLLWRTTARVGPSAIVAALFAVHPLHVESVAWVAERKDVLSTFFWLCTTFAYVRYVKAPAKPGYAAVILLFAMGMMTKTMLVTLPFTLLLLDYWPLNRIPIADAHPKNRRRILTPLVLEKWPLFAISILGCAVAVYAQRAGGSLAAVQQIPLFDRLTNAVVVYSVYLLKTIWPSPLAVFYPHPQDTLPLWQVGLSLAFLIAVTTASIRWARSVPALLVGWLWYLGTLVPVIGIVQIGAQSMADRYTYVPSIGIFIAVVWTFAERVKSPSNQRILAGLCACIILILSVLTFIQTGIWRDSETLFRHAVSVTTDNYPAEVNLGLALAERGAYGEAASHFSRAALIEPNSPEALFNLASAYLFQGNYELAVEWYRAALELSPNDAGIQEKLEVATAALAQQRGR